MRKAAAVLLGLLLALPTLAWVALTFAVAYAWLGVRRLWPPRALLHIDDPDAARCGFVDEYGEFLPCRASPTVIHVSERDLWWAATRADWQAWKH